MRRADEVAAPLVPAPNSSPLPKLGGRGGRQIPDDGSDAVRGDVKEGGVGNCCPLRFCPDVWQVPAGSVEKAATAMASCTAPVPAWFLVLTRRDPAAHGGGRWFPPPTHHCNVTGSSVGPGAEHSTRIPPCILAKEGLPRGGWSWLQEAGEGKRVEGSSFPFPALSSPVGPGAGGHRRELGSFLLLLGGQWPGVGDSHPGLGYELLLAAGAAPHGQTTPCGTQGVLGREQEPGWSGGGCLHPQGRLRLTSSCWWAMGP